MNKPKVIVEKNGKSNCYFPIEKIIILSSYNSAVLYHEYRHHIQAKLFGANFLLDSLKYTFTLTMVSIALLALASLINYFFPNPIAGEYINLLGVIALTSYAPTFLSELDANLFAIFRCYKKNKRIQFDEFVYSMLSYSTPIFITYIFLL